MTKITLLIILSLLSGIAYRMGGSGRYSRLCRILGVPAVSTLALILSGCRNPISLTIHFGILAGMISTYWDFLFGDVDNFYVHGLMCGLAALALVGIYPWWLILARAAILGATMGLWCKIFKWAVLEEVGRGTFIVASLLLFLL
jgi:hypothetical protein